MKSFGVYGSRREYGRSYSSRSEAAVRPVPAARVYARADEGVTE